MAKIEITETSTKAELDKLYDNDAFTWEGLSLPPEDYDDVYNFFEGVGAEPSMPLHAYRTSGATMNLAYGLSGKHAYKDDLHIVSFPLDGFGNPGALIVPKLKVGARWFSDIVDNNAAHMEEEEL